MVPTDLLLIIVAGFLLAVAAVIDLKARRIPNWLTLPSILLGATLLFVRCLYGYPVWAAALSLTVSLALPYLLWLTGSWGGGDAKACIGTFLLAGPALSPLWLVAAFSGCLALLLVIWQVCRLIGSNRVSSDKPDGRPLGPSLLIAYIISAGACLAFSGGLS